MATNTDTVLRQQLAAMLKGGDAHADFEQAIGRLPLQLQGTRPDNAPHSPWQILEHLRIAQSDILEFSRNPKHTSPPFPEGYWPETQAPPSPESWTQAADAFRADLAAMIELVKDEKTDLFAPLSHGNGQTVLRESLVLADHNAYHLGQLIFLRRLLQAWP